MDLTIFSYLNLLKILFISLVILTVNSQLTSNDLNHIKKTILSTQKENGLFSNSIETTYQSVYILKVLNEKIPEIPKICKEAQFELMKDVSSHFIKLNQILDCRIQIDYEMNTEDLENLTNFDIDTVHEKIFLWKNLENLERNTIFEKIKTYITADNLFSAHSNTLKSSLDATVRGLQILEILIENSKNEELKKEIEKKIVSVFKAFQSEFQILSENIGIYSRDNLNDFKTNSRILEILPKLNKFVNIEKFEELNFKLLNFFLTFKYAFTNTENIFYIVHALNALSDVPIIQLQKKVIDYGEEKSTQLRIVNAFNKELNKYNVVLKYKLLSGKDKDISETETEDEDLKDLEENNSEHEEQTVKIENSSNFVIPLEHVVNAAGEYLLTLQAEFSTSEKTFALKYSLNLKAITKVKLNHIKIAVTNSQESLDDKEVSIDYPKRSFKNLKATQNSVIKLKIKINYGDKQFYKIEQIFLRLKHTEYGKSYSVYSSKYQAEDEYCYIDFDLSDTNNIEPYEGIYELTLIVSDSSFENPIIWNFGKIDIKFKKPSDPSNMTPSYKNPQKEKMETSFTPEQTQNKNTILSFIFSTVILATLSAYFIYLKNIKLNIKNFPKPSNTLAFVFSIGLVAITIVVAYILLLFYLKLRIVEALLALMVILLPGSLIIFKALSHITIEV